MSNLVASQRIAVLISGQIRTDNVEIQKIADACKAVDAHVFISVWRKRGMKGFGGGQGLLQLARTFGSRSALAMPRNWIGANMRKVFPESDHIIPDFGDLNQDDLLDLFPGAQIDIIEDQPDLTIPYMDSNSLRMLYMINRCNKLKREAEERNGFKYDIVARHRPDIQLDYARAISRFNSFGKVIFPNSNVKKTGQMHDIFWVSNSTDDDTLSRLYSRANKTRVVGWNGIHIELCDWVENKKIPYVMFNCTTAGINDAAYSNDKAQLAAAKNLLTAINNRMLDVDAACGEIFCETFSVVFDAIQNNNFLSHFEINQNMDSMLTQSLRPKYKLFLLQAYCWQICFNKDRNGNDRFGSFIIAILIDKITRSENAAGWSITAFGFVFGNSIDSKLIIDVLLGDFSMILHNSKITQKLLQAVCNINNIDHKVQEEIVDGIAKDIVFDAQNWKWMIEQLQSKGELLLIIKICQASLDNGKYNRGLISQGIRASKKLNDKEALHRLLQSAAKVGNTIQTYVDLGQSCFISGDFCAAKKAYLAAASFEEPSAAIKNMLSKLEDY